MAGNNKQPEAFDEGYIPFDPSKHEEWDGGGRRFPVGHYTMEIVKFSPGKKGTSVAFRLKCLHGPGDTDDMKDQIFFEFFNIGGKTAEAAEAAGNFMKGFLAKVAPEAMEPANLLNGPKGPGIDFKFLSGGPNGKGAVIECDLFEDVFKDPKSGKEKTNTKLDRRSVKLVTPSSVVEALKGSAAAGAPAGGPAWGPAE